MVQVPSNGMTRIVTSVVHLDGRGNADANSERIKLGQDIVNVAKQSHAHLVVLPSGFLIASSDEEAVVQESAKPLLTHAQRQGIGLVVGIDVANAGKQVPSKGKLVEDRKKDRLDESIGLPYFLVGMSSASAEPMVWRQRVVNNSGEVSEEERKGRTLEVNGRSICVLACGEAFHRGIRDEPALDEKSVIVVPTHTAHGARFFYVADWAKSLGAPVVRSTHANSTATKTYAEGELASPPGATLRFIDVPLQ